MLVMVPVSVGELFDKIAILQIKARRIIGWEKQFNVDRELLALRSAAGAAVEIDAQGRAVVAELNAVNELLWVIEDRVRECESRGDFGPDFVALARSVYLENDRRAALKRRLNELTNSEIVEEKSYASGG